MYSPLPRELRTSNLCASTSFSGRKWFASTLPIYHPHGLVLRCVIIKTKAVTVVKCFYGNTYVPRRRSNFLPLRLPHSSQSPQFLEKAWKCHVLFTSCVGTPTCKNFWPHIMKPLVVLVKLCQDLSSKEHGRPPCWHPTSGYSCSCPVVSM